MTYQTCIHDIARTEAAKFGLLGVEVIHPPTSATPHARRLYSKFSPDIPRHDSVYERAMYFCDVTLYRFTDLLYYAILSGQAGEP